MRFQRHSVCRSSGFTLIELLTAMGIVAVLVSVAVPAVQRARASARDQDCHNRLRRVALALHNYHDVYRMFPPGWVSERANGEGHPSTGWITSLLPYLDEAPLYNKLNRDNVYKSQDLSLTRKTLPVLRCTSDSMNDANPLRGGWGTSNVSGNFGPQAIARWSNADYWPGQTTTPHAAGRRGISRTALQAKRRVHGIFGVNSRTSIRDVKDGMTYTILAGEKCIVSRSGIWPGPRSNYHESDVVSDLSHSSPLNRSETGFSSRHMGNVVNFVIGDGGVRPIHEGIDSHPVDEAHPHGGVLQLLAGRDDRQRIQNAPW